MRERQRKRDIKNEEANISENADERHRDQLSDEPPQQRLADLIKEFICARSVLWRNKMDQATLVNTRFNGEVERHEEK